MIAVEKRLKLLNNNTDCLTRCCMQCAESRGILLHSLISLISSCFNNSILHSASFPSRDAGCHISTVALRYPPFKSLQNYAICQLTFIKVPPAAYNFLLSISIQVLLHRVFRSSLACRLSQFPRRLQGSSFSIILLSDLYRKKTIRTKPICPIASSEIRIFFFSHSSHIVKMLNSDILLKIYQRALCYF